MKFIYPEHEVEKQIGFDFLRNLIEDKCRNPKAKAWVQRLNPFASYKQYLKRLRETQEFLKITLASRKPIIFRNFEPVPLAIENAGIEGFYLSLEEIVAIRDFLDFGVGVFKRLSSTEVEIIDLQQFIGETHNLSNLFAAIDAVLEKDGNVKRNANSALKKLHTRKDQLEKSLLATLDHEYKKLRKNKLTVNLEPTVKNGRYVIPIQSSERNSIEGVVQGESGSKSISYVEPLAVIQSNNELNFIAAEIHLEIRKLLILISGKIATHSIEIKYAEEKLGYLEFLNAISEYGIQFNAEMLELSKENEIELFQCRHPKLESTIGREEIIPLDFKLTEKKRLMIISGPNAGGKSVALKTLSFCQYALQCALPICADVKSKSIWFDNFLTDVGDNQSMDSDLSTYSAHLTAMKSFLEVQKGSTFIAIDEIGAGTDPQYGGPMAESMINKFNEQGFFGVITTHFSNLKAMASSSNYLINASMLFDTDKLIPLFKLSIGNPGSSFVFELANRIGISKKVLQNAKKLAGVDAQKFEQFLSEMDSKKSALHKTEQDVILKEKRLDELLKEYESLKVELVKSKSTILSNAKEEATAILNEANQQIEQTVKEIKEKSASKKSIQKSKEKLKEKKKELAQKDHTTALIIKKAPIKKIKWNIGDLASIDGETATVEIVKIMNNKAEVAINNVKSIVPLKRLVPVNQNSNTSRMNSVKHDLMKKMEHFNPKLDLRGKREHEAVFELRNYLDDAYSLGISQLQIIHGRGDGALKKATRQLLKSLHYIKDWNYEHADRGGDGATIVNFK